MIVLDRIRLVVQDHNVRLAGADGIPHEVAWGIGHAHHVGLTRAVALMAISSIPGPVEERPCS